MSISLNLKASLTKLATTQQITTWCSNFSKVSPKALGKRSSKIWLLKHTNKWRRKQSASQPPNVLSMPCTNNLPEMLPLFNQTSRQTGRHEDNATKTTKTNNCSNKVLDRPLSILLQHRDHGTINQFPWISIELKHLERMRKRFVRKCGPSGWHSSPERDTGCVFQLQRTRAFHLQLSH